jgi:signal transduction histidine kinase
MPPPEPGPHARGLTARLRVGQLLALVAIVPLAIVLAAVAVGIVTLSNQSDVRSELLDRLEPANLAASQLATALVDQETGVRGYELAALPEFLQPFTSGTATATRALSALRRYRVTGSGAALALVAGRVAAWRASVALPAIRRVLPGHPSTKAAVDAVKAKQLFDAIRTALAALQSRIGSRVTIIRHQFDGAARTTTATLTVIAVILLLAVLGAALTLQRTVNRPLARLSRAARRVSGGELSHGLELDGPRDIVELADDVEAMRVRLVRELSTAEHARAQLATTADDLRRSNAELEQFAYVASHDLQEPLRKVTSFCQLLQERYGGELDERADQYIEFAVDGAKRMQDLINDLLAFSRVGRVVGHRVSVPLGSLAEAAIADLTAILTATDGSVSVGELPEAAVEPTLMRTVFQNLVANAIKFHGDEPPRVRIDSRREQKQWLITVADNGIGIEPEYAERIFVIFQRLHGRASYAGTGIGLAMCRKVIEYHGGRIWLDTEYTGGARLCFTLPVDAGDF